MSTLESTLRLLDAVFPAVLAASWQGSFAIGLVLVVRQALGFRVAARWPYLLWGLVIIRLLVPGFVLPHSPASMENLPIIAHPFATAPRRDTQHAARNGDPVSFPQDSRLDVPPAATVTRPATTFSAPAKRLSWRQWTALAWLAGTVALGAWFAVCARRFQRRLHRDSGPVDGAIEMLWADACRRWLGGSPPRVRSADWVTAPALFGIIRPTLLLPRQSPTLFSEEDWEHIFAHEIAHLRMRDHWSQLLILLALCVHWFNPVVWVGLRRLRMDRELAADEWALRRWEGERALAYGETLFKTLLARPGSAFHPGMVGISEDGAQMKQRLRRITAQLPRAIYGSLAGLAALFALSAVLLGQGSLPALTPAGKTSEKAKEQSVALTLQPTESTPADASAEILAAVRSGDGSQVSDVLVRLGQGAASHQRIAFQVLGELLQRRELAAYTLLLDKIREFPMGKSWNLSDPELATLVQEGRTDFLEMLLARRLDLERLRREAKSASPATAEWIETQVAAVGKQRAEIEALGKAAAEGDLPTLQKLVDAGADVNGVGKDDNTPLIRAVFKDRLEAARFLLSHGAEVNKPRLPGWNYTALCLCRSVPMAELLVKAGADLHAKLYQRDVSILTYIARENYPDLVAWFIRQGLNPKMIGDNGETLLFYVGDARTAKMLLEAGVDPNHLDEFGQPAIATARNGAVAQALIDGGAQLRDFPEPLLPRMAYTSTAGAIETVLKAGVDQDAVTLQETLDRVDRRGAGDLPEKEKLRQLLIARGAKSKDRSEEPSVYYQGKVTTEDHAIINSREATVQLYQAYRTPLVNGSSLQNMVVDDAGDFPLHVSKHTETLTLAVFLKGYAATYAGPFAPPYQDKLDNIKLVLRKGQAISIEIVDMAGKAIPRATVQGIYPGPPRISLPEVLSDRSGIALLEHIGDTPPNVRVSADGYETDEFAALPFSAQPYRVMLRKALPLHGTVTATATGEPIAGATIRLAGVRGPHPESFSDPSQAPVVTTCDAGGRFTLASLRADSVYYFFVEAPKYGGVLIRNIKAGSADLQVGLGPELAVRGKLVNIPAGLLHRGAVLISYTQYFPIGDEMLATGRQVQIQPAHGEAEFQVDRLYAQPVGIRVGDKEIKVETQDLPKSDVLIDFAK